MGYWQQHSEESRDDAHLVCLLIPRMNAMCDSRIMEHDGLKLIDAEDLTYGTYACK